MEEEYKKKIKILEEQLATARQGFEAERLALEKKMKEMQESYE